MERRHGTETGDCGRARCTVCLATGGLPQVIGLTKLRTKFKQFEAKRQLLGMYDRFLADDRILPMLAKLLGSKFWIRKR